MPGAHKIGAAISGPRIAGGNFMDVTFSSEKEGICEGGKSQIISNPTIRAPPPQSLDEHCLCNRGGGVYFAVLLGSDNSYTPPSKNLI